jgi:hypothetical protein
MLSHQNQIINLFYSKLFTFSDGFNTKQVHKFITKMEQGFNNNDVNHCLWWYI